MYVSKILAAIAIFLFSATVMAANTTFASVTNVIVSNNGKVTVTLDADVVNPASCPQDVYVIDPGTASSNQMLATLMTAQAADFTVRLSINNTQCANGGLSPRISAITMRP